jgi:hypothetical protein
MSCSITDRYVTNCLLLVVALQAVLVRVVVLQTVVRQTVVPLIVALQAVIIRVNTRVIGGREVEPGQPDGRETGLSELGERALFPIGWG